MEFRLVYRGPLPSDSSRRDSAHELRMKELKNRIRIALHPQIRDFWVSHPSSSFPGSPMTARFTEKSVDFWEYYGEQHKVVTQGNHIHRFAPLITERVYNGCSISVLFLRRDMPNTPLIHQGDLDNRMKVLFDSLKMPKGNEVVDVPQPAAHIPCCCLIEDDKYIDHVSITTDRLLAPLADNESIDDVLVVIHVVARVVDSERFFAPL